MFIRNNQLVYRITSDIFWFVDDSSETRKILIPSRKLVVSLVVLSVVVVIVVVVFIVVVFSSVVVFFVVVFIIITINLIVIIRQESSFCTIQNLW